MENWLKVLKELTGIQLTPVQVNQFQIYENELLDWNQRINLTAIRDTQGVQIRHFVDSLSCALAFPKDPPSDLIDVGTGAGFPGLALKILWPQMHLTLVDSVGKKLRFCEHVASILKLEGVFFLNARAETIGQQPDHRECYHAAVGRAVAAAPVLAEYLLPLVKPGGVALMPRGADAVEEARLAQAAIRKLGGDLREVLPVRIPGIDGERFLVTIQKTARTPAIYPRLPGIAAKKPLS